MTKEPDLMYENIFAFSSAHNASETFVDLYSAFLGSDCPTVEMIYISKHINAVNAKFRRQKQDKHTKREYIAKVTAPITAAALTGKIIVGSEKDINDLEKRLNVLAENINTLGREVTEDEELLGYKEALQDMMKALVHVKAEAFKPEYSLEKEFEKTGKIPVKKLKALAENILMTYLE